jgi:type II secretory pathway component PulF
MAIELGPATGTAQAPSRAEGAERARRLGSGERLAFTERLALLLETGNPLHASLDALRGQSSSPATRELCEELLRDVSGGLPFSQALRRHPQAFSRAYVNVVAAAERGGFLAEALARLQELEERRRELRGYLVSALSYPALLALLSVGVIVFVLAFVFPRFSELFGMIQAELPFTTRALMAVSDLARRFWLPALAALAAGGLAGARWLRSAEGALAVDRLCMRVPLVRTLVIQLNLVQFARVMSLSLGNGVGILDALRASREVLSSQAFSAMVQTLETEVAGGASLARGVVGSAVLPPLAQQLIATGEASGELPRVLSRLADFYEREWRQRLQLVSKLAEPVMLLVMGLAVGLIVSSLLLPIFKLSRAVH